MTKSDVIARYQRASILCAIIVAIGRRKIGSGPYSSRELKDILEREFSCQITVKSIEAALDMNMGHNVAQQISDAGEFKHYQFKTDWGKELSRSAKNEKTNLVSRIGEIGNQELKSQLSTDRKNALNHFDMHGSEDLEIEFDKSELVDSFIAGKALENARSSSSGISTGAINWQMLGVVVALAVGALTIAIMKGWL